MMKNNILKVIFILVAIVFRINSSAQCPAITCPGNITVNNNAGTCGAIVNYIAPVGTDPCNTGGSITFNYTGAIVNWIVPAGVTSGTFEVRGAAGGTHTSSIVPGGLGAIIIGTITLVPGSTLKILVGQNNMAGNGGGGGSFVTDIFNNPLIIAGGGGGSGDGNDSPNKHGKTTTTGGTGSGGGGIGGTAGNGGNVALGNPWFQSGAGGGLLTDGQDGWAANTRGRSFLNGGAGGNIGFGIGGFGGGGNGSMYVVGGGGGGYSGGGSGSNIIAPGGVGGGGASYNSGTSQSNTGGVNNGNGLVIINYGGGVTTTQTAGLPSGALFPVGTTTNTFVVSNGVTSATCSFTVTVVDAQAPSIVCPSNITVNNNPGMCSAVVNYTAPIGTDNCPGVTTVLTAGLASGGTFPIGITNITYTATDAANNIASCSFTVTVLDAEVPTISCPSNVSSCTSIVNGLAPTFNDNCPVAIVTYNLSGATIGSGNNNASGTSFNIGVTTVQYIVTDASGNQNNCSFTVTINPTPTVIVPASASYCNGDAVPASVFASVPAGGTFAWTNSNVAVGLAASGTGNTPVFTATNLTGATISGTITVTPTLNGCVGTPANYTITVYPTPTAPTAVSVTICPNNSTTLTATAPGGTYEWFDAPVAGTLLITNASYTTPVLVANTTYYVQTTINGCVSPRTAVTVTIAPALVVDAGLDATICLGSSYALSVTPNGVGYTYVWDEPLNLGFSTIFNPTVSPTSTTTYTVTVTDPSNCVGSDDIIITVNPTPTVTVPASAAYCNGDVVPTSTYASVPAGGTFAWTNSNTAIGLAASGAGNTPVFTATNLTGATISGTITVTPTLSGCVGTPSSYTITVYPTPPAPTALSVAICPNNSVTLTATAPGGTYEWYDTPVAGTLLITNASYTTPVLVANTTYYVQTTVNGCVSPRTAVTVTIAPALVVDAGLDATICSGNSYTLGVTPNGVGYSYVWDEPLNMGFSTIFNPTVSPTSTTTYTVTVTDPSNCVGSDDIIITVNPTPTVTVPASAAYCNGDVVPTSAYASVPAGGTFAWTNSNTAIGLAASGAGNTPVFTATNLTGATISGTITVIPTVNGCAGTPSSYTISVNPSASTNAISNIQVCPGDVVPASAFTSTPAGGSFTWTNSNTSIGLAASGTGNTPTFTAINSSGSPVIATISVIATANGCAGALTNYTITVNPVVTSNSNVSICQGDSMLINGVYHASAGNYLDTLLSSFGCDSIITYNLTINMVSVANSNVIVCQGDSVFINGNYYSSAGSYPFTFTSSFGCDSVVIYSVSIAPLPSFNISGGASINIGESSNLAVLPGVFGTSYSWNPPIGLSCFFCQNPIATPLVSTWYYVTVTSAAGCVTTDSVYIEVDPSTNIYIPNIFSPNNDENNDIYLVRGKGVDQFNLAIYNRWGQLIFESKDIEQGWDGTKDGTPLNQGVFVYKLQVIMYNSDRFEQTGNITLIR